MDEKITIAKSGVLSENGWIYNSFDFHDHDKSSKEVITEDIETGEVSIVNRPLKIYSSFFSGSFKI